MKLHHTVVTKLIDICQNYGGYSQETKLREQLNTVDLSIYEQKSDSSEKVLVMTEDFEREVRSALNIAPK